MTARYQSHFGLVSAPSIVLAAPAPARVEMHNMPPMAVAATRREVAPTGKEFADKGLAGDAMHTRVWREG